MIIVIKILVIPRPTRNITHNSEFLKLCKNFDYKYKDELQNIILINL